MTDFTKDEAISEIEGGLSLQEKMLATVNQQFTSPLLQLLTAPQKLDNGLLREEAQQAILVQLRLSEAKPGGPVFEFLTAVSTYLAVSK